MKEGLVVEKSGKNPVIVQKGWMNKANSPVRYLVEEEINQRVKLESYAYRAGIEPRMRFFEINRQGLGRS